MRLTATTPAAAQFLTNHEAASRLRLSPRTMEKLRTLGGGPRFRKFGRRVLYSIHDLDRWANDRAYGMTSDPGYVTRQWRHRR